MGYTRGFSLSLLYFFFTEKKKIHKGVIKMLAFFFNKRTRTEKAAKTKRGRPKKRMTTRALTTIFKNNTELETESPNTILASLYVDGIQTMKVKGKPTVISDERLLFADVLMDETMCRVIFQHVLRNKCVRLTLDTGYGLHYNIDPGSLSVHIDRDRFGVCAVVTSSTIDTERTVKVYIRSVEMHSLRVRKEDEQDMKYAYGFTPYVELGEIIRIDCNLRETLVDGVNRSDVLCFYYF